MSIYRQTAVILSQQQLMEGIYDMVIEFPKAAKEAKPGQFLALYVNDQSRLLPRPISICGIDPDAGTIRMVYRVAGGGTTLLSAMKAGKCLEVMGPLGNGFPLEELWGKHVAVAGGGIGIPPMLELTKQLSTGKNAQAAATVHAILGYRDKTFLEKEFETCATMHLATEDGSIGTKGNVLDAMNADGVDVDVICACGPMPMLKAIASYAKAKGIKAYVSLEERMACGVGACLGCITKTREKHHHTNVENARICKDGPVFDAEDLVF